MASVVLQDVTKVFEGAQGESICAVNRASLTVPDKELLALVGPSGCGKTTLLRLIAGLEEPTAGTIFLDGQAVDGVPAKDRGVAMVFQNPALYPHLSVFENLAFGLQLRKCAKDEVRRRVFEAAEMLDLGKCLERKPQALSGGQRQRVSLGRALVRKPRVFLLDEPLSNLDAALRVQMRAEIARLQAQLAATMIYVTHDQVEASTLGKKVAVMNQGSIQQVAEPVTLYRSPANLSVAAFIGLPPINLIHGSIAEVGQALFFHEEAPDSAPAGRRLDLRLDADSTVRLRAFKGKAVILGLRQEDIKLRQFEQVAPHAASARTVAQLVQPLGWETMVYLATAAHLLVIRLPPAQKIEPQQQLDIALDLRTAHFFDPLTGKSICFD